MPEPRQSYVKPLVMQLHYMADPHVTIAQSCKQEGAAAGPSPTSCTASGAQLPCSAIGS